MPLTLEEIKQREAGIREEIAVRERLLAAYATVRADLEKGNAREARSTGWKTSVTSNTRGEIHSIATGR
jgi:hypothetical protein